MINKRLKLLILLLLKLELTGLQAQEATLTAGGNALGGGGSASYSVGQVVYSSNTGTNGTLSQGVQQAFEISVISRVEEAIGISLNCLVYPNPVNDFLWLKVENFSTDKLSFQLYNIQGELLETKKIEINQVSIGMSKLLPGTYFLRVIEESQEIKVFKIIKY